MRGPVTKRLPVTIRADRVVRQGRDENGRRVKRVLHTHEQTGELAGWEHHRHEGNVDAHVLAATVTVTLSARQFGLTVEQLRRVVELQLPPSRPRRSPAGLLLP